MDESRKCEMYLAFKFSLFVGEGASKSLIPCSKITSYEGNAQDQAIILETRFVEGQPVLIDQIGNNRIFTVEMHGPNGKIREIVFKSRTMYWLPFQLDSAQDSKAADRIALRGVIYISSREIEPSKA